MVFGKRGGSEAKDREKQWSSRISAEHDFEGRRWRESVGERFSLVQEAIAERSDIGQIKGTISEKLSNVVQDPPSSHLRLHHGIAPLSCE